MTSVSQLPLLCPMWTRRWYARRNWFKKSPAQKKGQWHFCWVRFSMYLGWTPDKMIDQPWNTERFSLVKYEQKHTLISYTLTDNLHRFHKISGFSGFFARFTFFLWNRQFFVSRCDCWICYQDNNCIMFIRVFPILVLDLAKLDELDEFIRLHMHTGINYPWIGEYIMCEQITIHR